MIAVVLYHRAIKLPLLPVFLAYFDVTFAIVLFGTIVVASILQGLLIDAVAPPGQSLNRGSSFRNRQNYYIYPKSKFLILQGGYYIT